MAAFRSEHLLMCPELSLSAKKPSDSSLRGVVLGYGNSIAKDRLADDAIGRELLPLIESEFQDRSCLEALKQSEPLRCRGIAGAFHEFPDRTGTVFSRRRLDGVVPRSGSSASTESLSILGLR